MSKADYGDRLGGYVEVKDRIAMFYAAHPDGRLVTEEVLMTEHPDGVPRVSVKALAYRTADDPHPGVGWSWMVLPGSTPYTKGSELENTETSAWGRAIGSLGIGIDKSIASAQEVANKAGESERKAEDAQHDGLTGTLSVKADKRTQDFALRQGPTGSVIGFRLSRGRGGLIVECHGALADQLDFFREAAVDATVTVWGRVEGRTFKSGDRDVAYDVLIADRVRLPEVGDLPAEPQRTDTPDDRDEAPSLPLFDAQEQGAIDEALALA